MNWMQFNPSVFGLAIFFCCGNNRWSDANAADVIDSRLLLQDVAETYRKLDSFEWTIVSSAGPGLYRFAPTKGAFRRPRHMRIDMLDPDSPFGRLYVTDGRKISEFCPYCKGYCHPQILERSPPYATYKLAWSLPYEHIGERMVRSRFVGKANLTVDGRVLKCLVVSVVYAPEVKEYQEHPQWNTWGQSEVTYWIDSETKLVIQQHIRHTNKMAARAEFHTVVYTTSLVRYRVNPELPDRMFKFKPPPGILQKSCLQMSSGGGGQASP